MFPNAFNISMMNESIGYFENVKRENVVLVFKWYFGYKTSFKSVNQAAPPT